MNPKIIRRLLLPALVGALLAPPATAGSTPDPDPLPVLRTATDQVQAIIYAPRVSGRPLVEQVQPVMEKYFDFGALTRRAVGPGWRQLTPAQQQRATRLLTELIVRNYCAQFDTSARSRVTYAAPVELGTGRCELATTVVHTGRNIAVTYRAELTPEGWRFYDVIVEGVSLVANYRAQFTALFLRGGADAIIHALEEKLGETLPA